MLALSPTQTTMTAVGDTICKAEKGHLWKEDLSNFFSYRFIINQILFLRNKNQIKNGPKGHAWPTKKGSRVKLGKNLKFVF